MSLLKVNYAWYIMKLSLCLETTYQRAKLTCFQPLCPSWNSMSILFNDKVSFIAINLNYTCHLSNLCSSNNDHPPPLFLAISHCDWAYGFNNSMKQYCSMDIYFCTTCVSGIKLVIIGNPFTLNLIALKYIRMWM